MTDDENLRKGFLLEDFAAVQFKLRALQAALHKEARLLEGIADYLKRGGECPPTVASALEGYLSGPLRQMIRGIEVTYEENEMLRRMLADVGIKV
jgi:hypothetical protein